jgi:hypothetical protein
MGLDRRGDVARQDEADNRQREDLSRRAKPFDISKREVWEAYKKVKANRGAAGVDRQTIEEFDSRLAGRRQLSWPVVDDCFGRW